MASNPKEIFFGEKARMKLIEGLNLFAKTIGSRLGPKKREIEQEPLMGKDSYFDLGVALASQVAHGIRSKWGDGGKVGIVLLNALIGEGLQSMTVSKVSPIEMKRGIDKGVEAALVALDNLSMPPQKAQLIERLEDLEVRQLINQALNSVMHSGLIRIEEKEEGETLLKKVEETSIDRGYLSHYFCTDRKQMRVEMHDVSILLTDHRIDAIQPLVPLLRRLGQAGKQLLVITPAMGKDVLSTLVMNQLHGVLKVAAIEAPSAGKKQKDVLEDLAVLTGGCVISKTKGMSIKECAKESLGSAERVEISKEHTVIIGKRGNQEQIAARVREMRQKIACSLSQEERCHLQERIDCLANQTAVIYVGGESLDKRKERRRLFEGGLKMVQTAQEEGIVPGGGVALLRAAQTLKDLNCKQEEKMGVAIVQKACAAPFKQIVVNAGSDSELYQKKVLERKKEVGFDVVTEELRDLMQAGVIDLTKIVKDVLKIAASFAGEFFLSEVVMVNRVLKRKKSE